MQTVSSNTAQADRLAWVVDDDASIAWVLEKALAKASFRVQRFKSAEAVLSALADGAKIPPDVLLTDIRMAGMSGIELVDRLSGQAPELPVIIMTAFGDLDSAVEAYRHGAFEYLTKPFDVNEMVALVERAWQQGAEDEARQQADNTGRHMLGESAAIQEVFRIIGRLSNSEMSVLICGESGTGKELVAEAIYQNSPRSSKPLVAINTAAIPSELLEPELFGHEKGAFTGAYNRRVGRFEQADGGTLFLDEIGDMPTGLQTRLLRVLSEGRFYRVGGREEVKVDVRVIAATNQNLEALVSAGGFRNDLFHRLNVITINTPSLRQRKGDIALLINHFLARAASELGIEQKHCSAEVLQTMQHYSWPGNIRELENLVRRLTVLAPSTTIQLSDLPDGVTQNAGESNGWEEALEEYILEVLQQGDATLSNSVGNRFESILVKSALAHTGGHKQKAARLIGWGRNTLTRKLKQLSLD